MVGKIVRYCGRETYYGPLGKKLTKGRIGTVMTVDSEDEQNVEVDFESFGLFWLNKNDLQVVTEV